MKHLFLKLVLVLIVCVCCLVGGGVVYVRTLLQPVDPIKTPTEAFVIPKGQAVAVIARRLEEAHLIRSALVFRILVKKEGLESQLQAGSFDISPAWSASQIARTFTKGSEDQWVTIPEGLRREEIATVFTDFPEFDAVKFLELTADTEGYLYPDTYLFPKAATTEFIVSYLANTFEKKTTELHTLAEKNGQDWEDVVTLASIIQREAKTLEQMKMVSGILRNRLAINQALEVDATLQYIKGQDAQSGKWWTPPLAIDKERVSPYNTYKNTGIPPAPICNPGLDALTAAVQPTESAYYFYLHADDGQMYYGKTYDEHLNNIAKYLR